MNLRTKNQKGFTIVELLIVIVVIAILAAISIVAYTGVQDNARNTQRKADAKSVLDAINAYYAKEGSWPGTASEGNDYAAAAASALGSFDTVKLSTATRDNMNSGTPDSANPARIQVTRVPTTGAQTGVTINYYQTTTNGTFTAGS